MKKNLQDIAKNLDIGTSTLYKWIKTRPKLYNFIIENSKDKNSTIENEELNRYFNELNENEKEMYLAEIKAKALRKKIK